MEYANIAHIYQEEAAGVEKKRKRKLSETQLLDKAFSPVEACTLGE